MTENLSMVNSGVVGVDEAGRGCLAGPVIAGCVILPKEFFRKATNRKWIEKINDSKQFDEATREELFDRIQGSIDDGELFGETGTASVKEIEKHNRGWFAILIGVPVPVHWDLPPPLRVPNPKKCRRKSLYATSPT